MFLSSKQRFSIKIETFLFNRRNAGLKRLFEKDESIQCFEVKQNKKRRKSLRTKPFALKLFSFQTIFFNGKWRTENVPVKAN